jgi:hypothetical protein
VSFYERAVRFLIPDYMKKLLLPALLGMATPILAQSDFRPGFVVQPSGDTLRGQVDYRGSQRSARICRFRPSETASATEFTPAQLRSYGFQSGRAYEARPLDSLGTSPVFLERLVLGKASLYYLLDGNSAEHFYLRKNAETSATELVRIIETVSRVATDGVERKYKQEKALYRGTLAKSFSDCPSVQLLIGKVPFTADGLTDIVQRYNRCGMPADAPIAKAIGRQASSGSFGVMLGGGQTQLTVEGPISLSSGSKFTSMQPVAGVFYMLTLPKLSEKLALRVEALYESANYEKEYTSTLGAMLSFTQQARIDFSYVRVPLLLRYTFPGRTVRLFAQAGMVNAFATNAKIVTRQSDRFSGSTEFGPWKEVITNDNSVRKYEQGLVGSIGLHLPGPAQRPLDVELRAERSNGFLYSTGIDSKVLHLSALLSYSLTK